MKRISSYVASMIILAMYVTVSQAYQPGKIDPRLQGPINIQESNSISALRLMKIPPAGTIPVFIKLCDPSDVVSLPLMPMSQFEDVITARITRDMLATLSDLPCVRYIQASTVCHSLLDKSIPEINVSAAYNEFGVSGRGIIIGIIDTGIDWTHGDFRHEDGTTRIKYLLDFSDPGDTDGDGRLDGPDAYGGTLYTADEINKALAEIGTVNETDVVGHGTHVAGCAAGNGLATGNNYPAGVYVGVAPEADLIIVKATRVSGSNNFESNDYINAMAFIDSVAGVLGQPYVVNMSLGGNEGPHDGTSLEEQAIDNLVGDGIPGKVVVVAAGNDGDKNIHASGTLSPSNNSVEVHFSVEADYTPNESTLDDYVLFEIWYDGNASMSVKLTSPNGSTYGPVSKGQEKSNKSNDGAYYISNATGGANPFNGDNQMVIQVFDYEAEHPPVSGTWTIQITGQSGHFDLWMTTASMQAELTGNTDASVIVATPGTAKNAITVGAYKTKKQWIDLDGHMVSVTSGVSLGSASTFSSSGPARDGRIKPEIAAPGEMIAAALSKDAPPDGAYTMYNSGNDQLPNGLVTSDGVHGVSQGTSFAAPHVAGVVALMLEMNPDADAADIKNALISSARQDKFTSDINKTGYGKLNAYEALRLLGGNSPVKNFSVSLFQNPALTQFIDIFLFAFVDVDVIPTAVVSINNNETSVTMTRVEPGIFSGTYEFANEGSAKLTFTVTPHGESSFSFSKLFNVVLLKPGIDSFVPFINGYLSVPGSSILTKTVVTSMQTKRIDQPDNWQHVSQSVKLTPEALTLHTPATLAFTIPDDIKHLSHQQLKICRLQQGRLVPVYTQIDSDGSEARALVTELGTYQLMYIPEPDISDALPSDSRLLPCYPNPFNARTTINYQLVRPDYIQIDVINIRGETIRHLFHGPRNPGRYNLQWNGQDNSGHAAPTGIYVVLMRAQNWRESRKILLLK